MTAQIVDFAAAAARAKARRPSQLEALRAFYAAAAQLQAATLRAWCWWL